MNLNNQYSKHQSYSIQNSVGGISGGFGNGNDAVGASYAELYSECASLSQSIESCVMQTSACCDRVQSIDVDATCKNGSALIEREKSFPYL